MRKFLVLAFIVGAGLTVWWVFGSRTFYFLTNASPSSKEEDSLETIGIITTAAKNVIPQVGKLASRQSEKIIQGIAANGKTAITNAETAITNETKNLVLTALNNVIDIGRIYLGATSATVPSKIDANGIAPISALLGSVAQRNQPVSFVMGSRLFNEYDVQEITVDVNWQDGIYESQKMYLNDQNNSLTHTFANAGTYKSLFSFRASSSVIQYEITIIVKD